jgi:hypothetical protein
LAAIRRDVAEAAIFGAIAAEEFPDFLLAFII